MVFVDYRPKSYRRIARAQRISRSLSEQAREQQQNTTEVSQEVSNQVLSSENVVKQEAVSSVKPLASALFRQEVKVSDVLSGKVKKVSDVGVSGGVGGKLARESESPMSVREDVVYKSRGKVLKPEGVSISLQTSKKSVKDSNKFDTVDKNNILISSLGTDEVNKAKAFEERVEKVEARRKKFYEGEGFKRAQQVGRELSIYAEESPFLPDLKLIGRLTGKKKELSKFQSAFYEGATTSGIGLGVTLVNVGENIAGVSEGFVKNPKATFKELGGAVKRVESSSFSFLPGGTPITTEGAVTVASAGIGAGFAYPSMKQNIVTRKSLETFYPDKFVKPSKGSGSVELDIAQAKDVVAESQASRGVRIKIGEPEYISLGDLNSRLPIAKLSVKKGVDVPEKPLLKIGLGKDVPEKPLLKIGLGKDVPEKPLLKIGLGKDVPEKPLVTIKFKQDAPEIPIASLKIKKSESIPEKPIITFRVGEAKYIKYKEPLFDRKIPAEGFISMEELNRRTPIASLKIRYDKPFEPYLKNVEAYKKYKQTGQQAILASAISSKDKTSKDIVYVEDYTIPRTRSELLKYEGKKADTIHVTASDIFGEQKSIIAKAIPGAAGKRAENMLLNFYKSAPEPITGKPQAYLGYTGILKKGSKASSGSKLVFGKPEPKLLIFEDVISPTPQNIVNKGILEINKYQVLKGSGKTFVPAENLASTSPEGQFITPSSYKDIPEAKKFGLSEGVGSVIERDPSSKFTFYTQQRDTKGVLNKVRNVLSDISGKDIYKMEIIGAKTKPVTQDVVLESQKIKGSVGSLDLSDYSSSYGKTRFVSPSAFESSGSVSKVFVSDNFVSSNVFNGKVKDEDVVLSSFVSDVSSVNVPFYSSVGRSAKSSGGLSSSNSKVLSSGGLKRSYGVSVVSEGSSVLSPSSVVSSSVLSSKSSVVPSSVSRNYGYKSGYYKYKPYDFKSRQPIQSRGLIGGKKPSKDNLGLVSVEVRRGGVFKSVGKGIKFEEAVRLGERTARGTAARTFRITKRGGEVVRGVKAGKGFYASKGGSVIESVQSAINTSGELKEITYKGILTQKRDKRTVGGLF